MKNKRFSKILEIINANDIETQEELAERLKQSGIDVTQATVSRDIKELGLIKVSNDSGKYKYAFLGKNDGNTALKLMNILSEAVISIDYAINTIVIKTLSGMGQAAGAAIDSLGWNEIIGTVAGDDTIFAAVKSEDIAEQVVNKLNKMIR